MNYTTEFLTLALVHLLAVASPGPDFAVILKQSLCRSRREAFFTSLGIGSGIFIHVGYCILGIGLLISQSILLFNVVKYVGAAYLIFIGVTALRAKQQVVKIDDNLPGASNDRCNRCGSFFLGFFTNLLNPKVTLFFLSIFTVVVDPSTPIAVQLLYGLWMAIATMAWFSMLVCLFSNSGVQAIISRFGHWVERLMGGILLLLGLRLALVETRA